MTGLIGDHIKAVVFDFDDTLVATIEAKWASHKHVARKLYGKELSDEQIREHWGKPMTELFNVLYGPENAQQALDFEHTINRDFPKVIFEDTLEILKMLRDYKKLIGLVSAVDRQNLLEDLTIADIPEDSFDYTQTHEDSKYHKPDPRVFDPLKTWLKERSIKPDQVVYIGDALHDMKAALSAGFEFIGVTTGLVTQEQFRAHGIKSADRLKELL